MCEVVAQCCLELCWWRMSVSEMQPCESAALVALIVCQSLVSKPKCSPLPKATTRAPVYKPLCKCPPSCTASCYWVSKAMTCCCSGPSTALMPLWGKGPVSRWSPHLLCLCGSSVSSSCINKLQEVFQASLRMPCWPTIQECISCEEKTSGRALGFYGLLKFTCFFPLSPQLPPRNPYCLACPQCSSPHSQCAC